jgi:hypothetical protein
VGINTDDGGGMDLSNSHFPTYQNIKEYHNPDNHNMETREIRKTEQVTTVSIKLHEISDSCSGAEEEPSLLGCYAVFTGMQIWTFQRSAVPSPSWAK